MRLTSMLAMEVAVATLAAAIFAATLIAPTWIEFVFQADLDARSGDLERSVAVVSALVALGASMLARWEWRRHRPAQGGGDA